MPPVFKEECQIMLTFLPLHRSEILAYSLFWKTFLDAFKSESLEIMGVEYFTKAVDLITWASPTIAEVVITEGRIIHFIHFNN